MKKDWYNYIINGKEINMKKFIYLSLVLFLTNCKSKAQQKMTQETPILTYQVQLPRIASEKPPMVILLHGYGSNDDDLFSLANHLPANLIVIAARAPFTLLHGSYSWFDIDRSSGTTVISEKEAEESRLKIIAFINQMVLKYNADKTKVFLMGFSQGAMMSFSVGLTSPQTIKGLVAMSGRILPQVKSQIATADQLQNLKVMIAHGTKDPVVPFINAKESYNYCDSLQLRPTFKDYPAEHTITNQEFEDVINWLKPLL